MAEKNLKDSNKANLAGILVGTIVVIALIQVGLKEVNDAYSALKDLGLVAGLTIITNILTSLLPADFKHKLVFLRLSNALPGHRSKLISRFFCIETRCPGYFYYCSAYSHGN